VHGRLLGLMEEGAPVVVRDMLVDEFFRLLPAMLDGGSARLVLVLRLAALEIGDRPRKSSTLNASSLAAATGWAVGCPLSERQACSNCLSSHWNIGCPVAQASIVAGFGSP
jgi:hypothetical protein